MDREAAGEPSLGALPENEMGKTGLSPGKSHRRSRHPVRAAPYGTSCRARLSQDGVLAGLHTPQWKNQQLLGGLSHRDVHRT